LNDLWSHASFFFVTPADPDIASFSAKWNEPKMLFFQELIAVFEKIAPWEASTLEHECKLLAAGNNLKPGDVLLPLRVMLVGGKFGPGVFDIAALIGKEETILRIRNTLALLGKQPTVK
jgi:glutamyl-tRNA synthetase